MQPWEILDKFTGHLRDVLARAIAVATEVGSDTVLPVHLLYSLSMQKGSVGYEILQKMKITTEFLQPHVIGLPHDYKGITAGTQTVTIPELTVLAKQALEKSMLVAHDYEHAHVGTEHLLSGLLEIKDPAIKTILEAAHITSKKIFNQLETILESTSKFPELENDGDAELTEETAEESSLPAQKSATAKPQKKQRNILDYFARDLTDPEVQKTIDPVIGRAEEIDRVIHVLSRRTKNNPVLLGDAGVGKTAIVEGLAKKIMEQTVPDVLLGKRVFALDMGLIIAGTMYRGEFEARLKQILEEVTSDPNLILFIDELHTIVGTGSSQGSMDAANMLKPALARGEIHCIGATTVDEYKKYIEPDPALERRFQAVYVEEPTPAKTQDILRGTRVHYEKFHGVRITDHALAEAVQLSLRFIQTSHLPDKALDLIDEAAAAVRVRTSHDPAVRERFEIQQEIKTVRQKKEDAVYQENFDEALALKEQERVLTRELHALEHAPGQPPRARARVTALDVAKVVARITSLPLSHILQRGQELYEHVEDLLAEKILGQKEATRIVAERLRIAAAGLSGKSRPLASFLFVGPAGVGKTEMAKQLGALLYPNRSGLLRLDMSEFSEGYGVSKLLGAPAGYVGYRESTPLFDKLKHQPHMVVLFDNVDKAHPDVLRLLLQILEEGQITTAAGKTISFKQTIIVLTMAAEKRFLSGSGLGFSGTSESQTAERRAFPAHLNHRLTEVLGDELLGRLDAVVPFYPLSRETLKAIIKKQVEELNNELATRQRALFVTEQAMDVLASTLREDHGARMVRSIIAEQLTHALTTLLATAHTSSHKTFTAIVRDGGIVIE